MAKITRLRTRGIRKIRRCIKLHLDMDSTVRRFVANNDEDINSVTANIEKALTEFFKKRKIKIIKN